MPNPKNRTSKSSKRQRSAHKGLKKILMYKDKSTGILRRPHVAYKNSKGDLCYNDRIVLDSKNNI